MNEILKAMRKTGASFPIPSRIKFQDCHLDCELWQEGDTVRLVQHDGTKAVGCWSMSAPARIGPFPETPVAMHDMANRLAMWLSASMDQHAASDEMQKHILAWLEHQKNM